MHATDWKALESARSAAADALAATHPHLHPPLTHPLTHTHSHINTHRHRQSMHRLVPQSQRRLAQTGYRTLFPHVAGL
jgi:hypothetical protein